jgi:NTE family protein
MTRVAVVLGAGGITGIAWLLGALDALHDESGWDPATADVISGTSAGAVAACVVAAGVPASRLLAMAEDQRVLDAAIARATGGLPPRRHWPRAWPGSLALGLTGLVASDPRHRAASLVGFLPRGFKTGDDIRGLTHHAVRHGWPRHTKLLVHACDYRSGRRVTFGADGAPPASLADAVVASAAVPAYYRPVRIGDRDYIDGGTLSMTNADAVAAERPDVVICMSPFSSREIGTKRDSALLGPLRRAASWRARPRGCAPWGPRSS